MFRSCAICGPRTRSGDAGFRTSTTISRNRQVMRSSALHVQTARVRYQKQGPDISRRLARPRTIANSTTIRRMQNQLASGPTVPPRQPVRTCEARIEEMAWRDLSAIGYSVKERLTPIPRGMEPDGHPKTAGFPQAGGRKTVRSCPRKRRRASFLRNCQDERSRRSLNTSNAAGQNVIPVVNVKSA